MADPTCLFRIFSYPVGKLQAEDGQACWGVGEHTDYGLLTLLFQDTTGGLQVKNRANVWVEAPPLPATFIVNLGDMLEVMTAGLYRSTPHRARNTSGRPRLSFPFFFDPAWDARPTCVPLPPQLQLQALKARHADGAEGYRRWDGALLQRFRGTYGEHLVGKVAKAPWVLCLGEVLAVLLIYLLATSRAIGTREPARQFHFSYMHSLEDVVGLSCVRATLLSLAYAAGMHHMHRVLSVTAMHPWALGMLRPYLYASYLLAASCFPYLLVKMILFRYSTDAVPAATIFIITGLLCWLHVFAASRRTVEWARRRYLMGLAGIGYPWDESDEAWGILRRPPHVMEPMSKACMGPHGIAHGGGQEAEDVPAEMLCDEDSRFVEVDGIKVSGGAASLGRAGLGWAHLAMCQMSHVVPHLALMPECSSCSALPTAQVHYKEAWPPGLPTPGAERTAVVLIHGFGGGVFAWRHVMGELAAQSHCRVLAFDRPGFGLTSRPLCSAATRNSHNPYAMGSQALLLLRLCVALGLDQVVLAAHADGCLVALRAAALVASESGQCPGPSACLPPSWALAAGSPGLQPPGPEGCTATSTSPLTPAQAKAAQGASSPSPQLLGPPCLQQQLLLMEAGQHSSGHSWAATAGTPSSLVAELCRGSEERSLHTGRGLDGSSLHHHYSQPMQLLQLLQQQQHGGRPGAEPGTGSQTRSSSDAGTATSQLSPAPSCASSHLGTVDTSLQGSGTLGSGQDPTSSSGGFGRGGPAAAAGGPVGKGGRGPGMTKAMGQLAAPLWGVGPAAAAAAVQTARGTEDRSLCLGHPVRGLALLHPNLGGQMGPRLSRLLARSQLGRTILRPLLRSEIGEVANRRAWHKAHKLTPEVLELYKAPLRVEGWCESLIETSRLRREHTQGDLSAYLASARLLPALLLTGEHDRIVPPMSTEQLSAELPYSRQAVVQDCGHLSHEEAPVELLQHLGAFCSQVLALHGHWKQADGSAGEFTLSAGKWFGDAEADKGIQTGPDSKFFASYAAMDSAIDTTGKDLVLQFSVKHEQDLDCGGGYIKLLPASSADQMESFGGDTPYSIMFGPDICGFSTKKVHVIFTYKGTNYLIKKDIQAQTDQLTHVYTLVVKPDNTYRVLIDLKEVAAGSLTDDWDMLPPKTIKDPKATKPEDWDEREKIADPEDVKPDGWDDIPATIADPDAKKPEDWDDEEDGTWEAPTLPNPEFKGEWKPKMIDNPAYKGIWVAPDIPNPDFVADDSLYAFKDLKYLGFELWQVKSGSIFDNIFVGDSLEEAEAFANETWAKSKDAEKAAFDKIKEEERKLAEESAKKAAADAKSASPDDDDDDEDDDDEDEAAIPRGKDEL
ncbi:hypothetical protein QJQ45_007254 [Haematococcus lacustris]|nr:hypothetical protein QJQ45_007254 [Haematococcus lacustris]